MKKLSKIMLTCVVFLLITTAVYATDILPENKFGIRKVAILIAGVFLVVQILFIAYQKDKSEENILLIEEPKKEEVVDKKQIILEKEDEKINFLFPIEKTYEWKDTEKVEEGQEVSKIKKEEQDLFTPIVIESKIETLPDKMSPKKKNIVLKKEVVLEEKKISNVKREPRGSVKIVRERKNRNLQKVEESLKTVNHLETKNAKQKLVSEEQKNAIQLANEVKEKIKNEVIEAKERSRKVGKESKKRMKKSVNSPKRKNKHTNKK